MSGSKKTADQRRIWRANNRLKVRAQNARYRKKHAEEIAAKRRAKAPETRAKYRAEARARSKSNPPILLQNNLKIM